MKDQLKQKFAQGWEKHFGDLELPIAYYYADEVARRDLDDSKREHRCLIGNLSRVRAGHTFVYSADLPGCLGGKRYTGYSQELRPDFEYFLSCGLPGRVEGERYKKSPELVREFLKSHPPFEAPAKYLVFKRWDKLSKTDEPLAVIFFAGADVLSGLFTLANYDTPDPHGVVAPMGAGCSSIVNYPLQEAASAHPRCVLGMFDVSARPHVRRDALTFAIPMARFEEMVSNMDESFLTTGSWASVRKRIHQSD